MKIGITIGDLNGVGAQVVVKALNMYQSYDFTPIVYASPFVFDELNKQTGLQMPFHSPKEVESIEPNVVNVICCSDEKPNIQLGKTDDKQTASFALKSIEKACQDAIYNKIDAIVTAPINKLNIQANSFDFLGHTEYFNSFFQNENALMLMVYKGLRVGVVTGHIPLNHVSKSININRITQKVEVFNRSLKQDFNISSPKIAILGLNPHSGENGLLGSEEQQIVLPAIQNLKSRGFDVEGAFAADGFFGTLKHEKYDGVLAMYHDQGLVPFKTLAQNKGVNCTVGLPIVRTSPDHGTAFDVAGQNIANSNSMFNAIDMAKNIVENRKFS